VIAAVGYSRHHLTLCIAHGAGRSGACATQRAPQTLAAPLPGLGALLPREQAPAFASSGTGYTANPSTLAPIGVPGVVAGDIILAVLSVAIGITAVTALPTGFTEAPHSPSFNGIATHVYWKRATGSDAGTYDFTIAAGSSRVHGWAARFSGCVASGNPFDTDAVATGGPAYPDISLTTTGPDRLLVGVGWNFDGDGSVTTTQPSGFTKRVDDFSHGTVVIADEVQAVAGSVGTLSATASGGTGIKGVWLGALLPVASAPANSGQFFAMFW
jgi:hypothetical protein